MELILWLLFYDSNWFTAKNISWNIFKLMWLIPLTLHIYLSGSGITLFYHTDYLKNNASLQLWLFSRTFFSLLLTINILLFLYVCNRIYKKETSHLKLAEDIFPEIKSTRNDFLIIRKCIISIAGFGILFLGMCSLILSYLIVKLYYLENKFQTYSLEYRNYLSVHLYVTVLGNIPFIISVIIYFAMKLGCLFITYTCPGLIMGQSKYLKHLPNYVKSV
jgi:hypothetical protein